MHNCTALTSNTMRWSSVLMTPLRLGKMVNDDAFACFASAHSWTQLISTFEARATLLWCKAHIVLDLTLAYVNAK